MSHQSSSRRDFGCLCLALAVLAATGAGCATVTRGANERFTVRSEPSEAIVRLDTGQVGFTPITFKVPRKGDIVAVVSKEGYETKEVLVKSGLAGGGAAGFIGNAVVGGVIGGAMDIGTGAMLSHKPNPLLVVLTPKAHAESLGLPVAVQPDSSPAIESNAPVPGGQAEPASSLHQ